MGLISSNITYAPKIQFVTNNKGAHRNRLKLENVEHSIAFKTEKQLHFFNKRNFVPLQAKNEKGRLITVYINIKSLARTTGLTAAEIKTESQNGHLEALVRAKVLNRELATEKGFQIDSFERNLRPTFYKMQRRDSSLTDQEIEKIGKALIALETRLEKDGTPYLDRLSQKYQKNGNKPLMLDKGKTGLPYSFEYRETAGGKPLIYVKYQANFARGAAKRGTKAVDFTNERVLVKSKLLSKKDFEDEVYGYTNMRGIRGALTAIEVLEYKKNGKGKAAIYTDYKNLGDLLRFERGGEWVPLKVPEEQKKEVFLLGLYYLLETLEQIHAKELVHRDVKGNNIFIAKNDQGKYVFFLGDPGISSRKDMIEHYKNGSIFAPEQKHDLKEKLSEKVDIYALGVVFEHIFQNEPQLTPFLGDLVILLANAPDIRYSATKAKAELRKVLDSEGIDPDNNRWAARAPPPQ